MKVVQLEAEDPKEKLFNRLGKIELLLTDIREGIDPSLGKRFMNAAIAAFASIFGAAVLLAIVAAVLQPFTRLEIIGDRIDRVLNTIERKDK